MAADMAADMIAASDLCKYYGDDVAVDELNFSIKAGQIVGLLGQNGAGKTTTLRMLSGLLLPSGGRVDIDGQNLWDQAAKNRRQIGFLPEIPPLYSDMTVADYLLFAAKIRGLTHHQALAAVNSALNATDLAAQQNQRIGTLSFGYQKRVGIAQAIVHRPKVVLLDEPTSGLDPVQVVKMRSLIAQLKGGHTVVVSSHILSEIHQFCDELIVLHQGRVVAAGPEAALARQLTHCFSIEMVVVGAQAPLHRCLSAHTGIEEFSLQPQANDVYRMEARLRHDCREALVAALVAAGIGIRHLARGRLELEDIFLSLTQTGTTAAAKEN